MRTDVRLLNAALVRAHMVAHPVFPLEALLADGAGVGLLVRMGQAVAVEVVDVSEGLAAGLTGVVLPHLVSVGGGIGILWSRSYEDSYEESSSNAVNRPTLFMFKFSQSKRAAIVLHNTLT